jgi:hypothetical protein
MISSDNLYQLVLTLLGGWTVILGVAGGFFYWLSQRAIESRFQRAMEDYRHSHSEALQNEKLRLDLFNRRFAIFDRIFDFYSAMFRWTGSDEQKSIQTQFFRSQHEAVFLFSEESGIPALLKSMDEKSRKVIAFKENPEAFKSDPVFFRKLESEVRDIIARTFEEDFLKLKVAIRPYLDFSKIAQG